MRLRKQQEVGGREEIVSPYLLHGWLYKKSAPKMIIAFVRLNVEMLQKFAFDDGYDKGFKAPCLLALERHTGDNARDEFFNGKHAYEDDMKEAYKQMEYAAEYGSEMDPYGW